MRAERLQLGGLAIYTHRPDRCRQLCCPGTPGVRLHPRPLLSLQLHAGNWRSRLSAGCCSRLFQKRAARPSQRTCSGSSPASASTTADGMLSGRPSSAGRKSRCSCSGSDGALLVPASPLTTARALQGVSSTVHTPRCRTTACCPGGWCTAAVAGKPTAAHGLRRGRASLPRLPVLHCTCRRQLRPPA